MDTSSTIRTLTIDQFFDAYKPVKNHIATSDIWGGCMFEPYGIQMDHVRRVHTTDPAKVWTILEADGVASIGDGLHFVNRTGYIITEVPAEYGIFIDVVDDDDAPVDDEND